MKIITYVAMLLAVIIAALAVTCTIKKAKGEYDERQELIRGKGYRISFFLYSFEFALLMFMDNMDDSLPMTYGAFYAIAFMLPICVFVIYCISKDAFVGITTNIIQYILLVAFIALVDIAVTIVMIIQGKLIVGGKLTSACITPVCGVLFLIVLVMLLVRNSNVQAEKGTDNEES